jgi:hypothetical protein
VSRRLTDRVLSEFLGLSLGRPSHAVDPMDPEAWRDYPVWRRALAGLAGVSLPPRASQRSDEHRNVRIVEQRRPRAAMGTPNHGRVRVRRRAVLNSLIVAVITGAALACTLSATKLGVFAAVLVSACAGAAVVVGRYMAGVGAAVRRARHRSRSAIAEIEDRIGSPQDRTDILRRLDESQRKLDDWVDDRLSLIMSVPELFNLQRRRPSAAQSITKLMRDAALDEERLSALSARFLTTETASFASLLSGLGTGRAAQAGDAPGWKLALAEVCNRSIDAVRLVVPDPDVPSGERPFNTEPDGPRLLYLEARRRAIEDRRVRARELLAIYDIRFASDPLFIQLCESLSRTGIDIRYIVRDEKRPELFTRIDEFTLFDGEISYETVLSPSSTTDRPVVSRTELVVEREAVERRVRLYAELWGAGLPVSDLVGEGGG